MSCFVVVVVDDAVVVDAVGVVAVAVVVAADGDVVDQ